MGSRNADKSTNGTADSLKRSLETLLIRWWSAEKDTWSPFYNIYLIFAFYDLKGCSYTADIGASNGCLKMLLSVLPFDKKVTKQTKHKGLRQIVFLWFRLHTSDPHGDHLGKQLGQQSWDILQRHHKQLTRAKRIKSLLVLKLPSICQLYIPSFIPPHCLEPSGLQGCHDDIYIIVPISQHALLMRCHQSAGRKPATSWQETDLSTTYYAHGLKWLVQLSKQTRSPLVDLLQGVPAEGCPVLEDVIERVQGAQLPPLLLMINSWRC